MKPSNSLFDYSLTNSENILDRSCEVISSGQHSSQPRTIQQSLRLPDFVIIPPTKLLKETRETLESDWLFTIDYECVLDLVIDYIYDLGLAAQVYTLPEYVMQSMEQKAKMTPRQEDTIESCVKSLGSHLVDHLIEHGLVDNRDEYLCAKLYRLLPDGAMVLRITEFDPYAIQV